MTAQRRPLLIPLTWALLLAASLLAGCSRERPLPTYPVQGRVTFKGMPVTEGSVLFSAEGDGLPLARGRIQPDGGYSLTTYGDRPGAAAGEYRVAICAFDSEGQEIDTRLTPPRPLVPLQYTDVRTTPLVRRVEATELNSLDFEL